MRSTTQTKRLSKLQYLLILGIALAIFFVGTGPIWHMPWEMFRAIIFSYIPIPFLVFFFLLYSRKLSVLSFFLDTLAIGLWKFAITFVFATVLWAVAEKPLLDHEIQKSTSIPIIETDTLRAPEFPPPTPIDPEQTGTIIGQVFDQQGNPIPNAFVFIDQGLEDFVFSPPTQSFSIKVTENKFLVEQIGIQAGQPLLLRSTDGRLHTLKAQDQKRNTLFNLPAIATKMPKPRYLSQQYGLVSVHCGVHPTEASSHLAILAHPFFMQTDENGRFAFSNIPANTLRLVAWFQGRKSTHSITLTPKKTQEILVEIPPQHF